MKGIYTVEGLWSLILRVILCFMKLHCRHLQQLHPACVESGGEEGRKGREAIRLKMFASI